MALTIINAYNPVWGPDRDTIYLNVQFYEIDDIIPFAARRDDMESHGRQLFENAAAGMYGHIAPPMQSEEDQVNNLREQLIGQIDNRAGNLINNLTGIKDIVHQEKHREALAIANDPFPIHENYPMLSIDGNNLNSNAKSVIDQHKQKLITIAKIERIRVSAKQKLQSVSTINDLNKAFNSIVWPES